MFANRKDQELAFNELSASATGRTINAEPSSLASFAVLPTLSNDLDANEDERILVVNTGFGLLSEEERRFLGQRSFL